MRVPTTIELGLNDKKHENAISSFYDRESRIIRPDLTYGWDSLKEAHLKNGKCEDAEKPCAHIIPEMWYELKNGTKIEGRFINDLGLPFFSSRSQTRSNFSQL